MKQPILSTLSAAPSQTAITPEFLTELHDFVENAPLPLHWIDSQGMIIWANQAELNMLGYKKEDYLHRHISFIHADEHVAEEMLRRLSKPETLCNFPARLRCSDGSIKHVLINSNVALKDGKFSHTRCYTTDITEFRKEELRTRNELARLQDTNTRLLWKTGGLRQSDQYSRIFSRSRQ